jgi:membrane-bound metal-dependent hydrolase YbcI (DUF457 family)
MQGKNHLALALAAPLGLSLFPATANLIGLPPDILAWAGLALGSLAPDIDGGGAIARPSKFLPSLIPEPILDVLDRIGLTISKIVRALVGHRGATHWPVWGVAMVWAGFHWGWPWLAWFGIGYLLHILGDALTVQGVPVLGPLISKKFSLLPLRTGGRLETFFGGVLWLAVVVGLAVIYLPGPYAVVRDYWALIAYRLTLK